MSKFIVDYYHVKIWYDLKSNKRNYTEKITSWVRCSDEQEFYVRPHREDGPSIVYSDGDEYYCIHGEFHREDGPAIIENESHVEFWLKNIEYSFKEWCIELGKSEEEINFLKLKYPTILKQS